MIMIILGTAAHIMMGISCNVAPSSLAKFICNFHFTMVYGKYKYSFHGV